MIPEPVVSVVVPTVGRTELGRAVASALAQTHPVAEVLVVADTTQPVELPADHRVRLVRPPRRLGSSRARQFGIDAAAGTVIALLDDDDEWLPEKLARQFAHVDAVVQQPDTPWIASCGVEAVGPDGSAIWPRRPIRPDESVPDYLFRFHSPRFGGATLQTSTLCFPVELARQVRWNDPAGAVHDDIRWLLDVRAALAGVAIVQLPDPLVRYHLTAGSQSRNSADRTTDYLAWGRRHLTDAPRRTRGDYFLTGPVAAAVAAGSPTGVLRATGTGLRCGRPGPAALLYAAAGVPRAVRRGGWTR
ncbi:glycosyltransferase family 2 protein [Skermania piniformis]|uniref:Glycosyltransferase family 2 protein n=1 Tax=Skermania pinensis TaxID=39122 RepID=A0ABX8SD40_9ACTN|nr:glycosyltransferase family A protein [Skermania piniformis]QXQ15216.1 glycosyltransferase family 2 protein [Skermania piniformis]